MGTWDWAATIPTTDRRSGCAGHSWQFNHAEDRPRFRPPAPPSAEGWELPLPDGAEACNAESARDFGKMR